MVAYTACAMTLDTAGEVDKAIDVLTQGITCNPNEPTLYSNRARAHARRGEHAQAIEDCTVSIQIDPYHEHASDVLSFIRSVLPADNR